MLLQPVWGRSVAARPLKRYFLWLWAAGLGPKLWHKGVELHRRRHESPELLQAVDYKFPTIKGLTQIVSIDLKMSLFSKEAWL